MAEKDDPSDAIQADAKCQVTRDIIIDGEPVFKSGQSVTVDKVSPHAENPQYKYVVMSPVTGKRFLLTDSDLTLSAENPKTQARSKVLSCDFCRGVLADDVLVCGHCGMPSAVNIGNHAAKYNIRPDSCSHRWIRHNDELTCVRCGMVKGYLLQPNSYRGRTGCRETCSCCDITLKGMYYCESCGAKIAYGKHPVGYRMPNDAKWKTGAAKAAKRQGETDAGLQSVRNKRGLFLAAGLILLTASIGLLIMYGRSTEGQLSELLRPGEDLIENGWSAGSALCGMLGIISLFLSHHYHLAFAPEKRWFTKSFASGKEQFIRDGITKRCPYCTEIVKEKATVCRHCGKDIGHLATNSGPPGPALQSVQTTEPPQVLAPARFDKPVEQMAASETKACPFCAETIKAAAIKCRYCGSDITQSLGPPP